ncbi:MAG: ABC transporter permease [Mycobacteriaceae bacterium]|jgi:ABC-2 type transport system permease protein
MSLLNVERIKLTTTRSPWWCAAVAALISFGFALLFALTYKNGDPGAGAPAYDLALIEGGTAGFGMFVIMIMAALSITTEYRFGIVRTTFQAVPRRWLVLTSKATFLGLVGLVLGEIFAFGSLGIAKALNSTPLPLTTSEDWRQVAGIGVVYALAAILAVAVGALLRQSAGAIALLLLFPLLVENLVGIIPRVGDDIQKWMPFRNASNFLSQGTSSNSLSHWGSLGYFAFVVAVVFGLAVLVVERRDA